MKRPRIIIIANNQPLNNDAQIRRRMAIAEKRASRQSDRYKGLDLAAIQNGVHLNILKLYLSLDGQYLDLLDLMNFLKNGRKSPEITRENVSQYYSLANTATLNGIYLYQFLVQEGFEPVIVQNYATAHLPDILSERPLAICISSNFIFMDHIRSIGEEMKGYYPDVPIFAGGMLVKKVLDPGEALSRQASSFLSTFQGKVDAFVIESQGEQTLLNLLNALRDGEDLGKIPNLALFNEDGKLSFTRREKENLPIDRTAIDWERIPRSYLRRTLPVNSSRGCYYRCRFCTYHWFFPQVQYKSLDVLKKELRQIQDLGHVRHVRFTDDNFTANEKRLTAVLEMMIEEGFDFKWSSFARASALKPDLVKLMKSAGCEFVDMGLESGSQTILDNMEKKLKREQALEAVKMLNDEDIFSRGSFIVGYPGETKHTFSETIDFINESGLPFYHPYLFYYSGRSLVHEDRERFGLEGLGLAWRHNTMDAVEASALISRMARKIPASFTDGVTYIEEIYKLLRGEGYSPDSIFELFKLKRELQMLTQSNGSKAPFSSEVDAILRKLETLLI